MEVFTSLHEVPEDFGPSAVAIGKFDGVHRGHQAIIERLRVDARAHSLVPTIVTFDRNPLSVLAPEACPVELVSNAQRLELLQSFGVAATVMLEFTRSFSENSPSDFVEGMLVSVLHAKLVMVGADFRFGRGGTGNVAMLQEFGEKLGFTVDLLPTLEQGGRRLSSTWVRELLSEGNVEEAEKLLGREHAVRGVVVRGAQRGRELGFPTANLSPDAEGFIPADGVYAAWAIVEGRRYRAAVSIGNNPTFEGTTDRHVEAYLLGRGNDPIELGLYGKSLELRFVERLRGMKKFDSREALVKTIAEDVERVRALLPDVPVTRE